jgi:hypothetical protein
VKQAPVPKNDTINAVFAFLQGFFTTLNVDGDVNQTLACSAEGGFIKVKVDFAYAAYQKTNMSDPMSVFALVYTLADVFKETTAALAPCYLAPNELKALYNIMEKDPENIVKKMVYNALAIFGYFTAASTALSRGDLYTCGLNVGNIGYILLLTNLSMPTSLSVGVLDFIRGLFEGINEKGDIEEFVKCLNNLEPIIQKIVDAIVLIISLDIESIMEGIRMFVEAVKELLAALQPCSKGYAQLEKLRKAIANVNMQELYSKIMTNIFFFIQIISEAVEHFGKQELKELGICIGKILGKLFL